MIARVPSTAPLEYLVALGLAATELRIFDQMGTGVLAVGTLIAGLESDFSWVFTKSILLIKTILVILESRVL